MQKKNTIKKSALAPTIIIAGGAGFIGSHLAEVLLKKEARIIVLDNFSTGKDVYVNHLLNNPKFALFDININEGLPPEIESVDYIFHLAGLEEYLYEKNELTLDSLLTNAVGTKNLLDLAFKSEAKFVLASTLDVYQGMMSQLSLNSYFGPTSQEEKKYSLTEAKRYAEALVWEYHKKTGLDARIVRFPEVFGPRMNLLSSGSLGKFLRELIDGKEITVLGDGSKKEFYLYITDAVSGLVKALLNEETSGKIFSLIPKEPLSVLEIAYLVRSLADRVAEIKFIDEKTYTQSKEFQPDIYNLSYLSWEPKIIFKDGVVNTLTWFGYRVNERSFKNSRVLDIKDIGQSDHPLKLQNIQNEELQKEFQRTYDERKITEAKKLPKIKSTFKIKLPLLKLPIRPRLPNMRISLASKVSLFAIVLLSFLGVFVLLPFYETYSEAKKAMSYLEQTPQLIAQFDTLVAADNSAKAYDSLIKSKKAFISLKWFYQAIGQKNQYTATSKFLNSVSYFSKAASDIALSTNPFQSMWDSLKPNSEIEFNPNSLNNSRLHISDARNNLQMARADFEQIDANALPTMLKNGMTSYNEVMQLAFSGLDLVWAVTSDLPGLLGFDGPKKYLILFQNNNELRPTGGFIGSYAYLYLNRGKIEELAIDDIYNPDGQIDVRNIKVLPPKPMGDFLAEDRLYIRNANWDPDFSRSAQTIRDLFYRLDGEEISGVIAIDLEYVKNMLSVTGPIFLAAYNEEVTAQNLYERTQFHASYDYHDGSQQKKQFLTVLGSKMLEVLFSLDKSKTPGFFEISESALAEKHIQMHLFSNQFNAFIQEKGWNGQLTKTEGDYLNVINANLGGTKANYYVKNTLDYEVASKTRDGLLRAELSLTYNHTGEDESWPGGPYTNYLRVLTQKGSKLTGAKMIYNKSLEEDKMEEIIISQVEPYTSFETSFVLNPSESLTITFYYDLPVELSLTKDNSIYTLVWQKQAGTHNDDFSYTFRPPFGMEVASHSNTVKIVESTAVGTGKLNSDYKVELGLQ